MKSILNFLERKLAPIAIPHTSLILAVGHAMVWAMAMSRPDMIIELALIPNRVEQGEWYRLWTFLFIPPSRDILTLFAIYLFAMMGEALESQWGRVRYNLYLLIAIAATMAVAWMTPAQPTSVTFIGATVFLAFAWLYPDFQLMIFFILPVKIKYLALISWIGFLWVLVYGDMGDRLQAVAGVLNFMLFFGQDILTRLRYGQRKMSNQVAAIRSANKAFHRCVICQRTERDDPTLEFRYCSKCIGDYEYCSDHLQAHEHHTADEPSGRNPSGRN